MSRSITRKLLEAHILSGTLEPGSPVALRMDQTLTQDATGTMAWLQFEALGLPRVRTELSVSYADHNTLQMGFRNADDHRFLRSAAQRFGAVFSPAGTGICHQLHLENFARPGATLLGSDSHTPMAGGMGMLAMGAGGLSVALAMAGKPYTITMPKVLRVYLHGALKGWASAKDVILHLLRLLSVKGGVGRVLEYDGPGVATLSVPERATITNMGAELGATASIFPSDESTRAFLKAQGREGDWTLLAADADAAWDEEVEVNLSALVPLVAQPHMPDRVVPVADLAGLKVDQVSIGSCTNSSYMDLALVAQVLQGRMVCQNTETAVSPGSKQVLTLLAQEGLLASLLGSGVRLLECACGPCIGMGGSPVSGGVSVRTFNRNFEGRSGTRDASVYLASPATAAHAALHGSFTAPESWGPAPERPVLPARCPDCRTLFVYPPEEGHAVEVLRGPNIVALETFPALEDRLRVEVVIKVGDNCTTDHIMPAGAEITALRSNVPAIAEHVFGRVDSAFVARARAAGQGIIVARDNYGQGSSREHAALVPRHLGIRAVLACSLARIHKANLVNFGILPLTFADPADYDGVQMGVRLLVSVQELAPGVPLTLEVEGGGTIMAMNDLSAADVEIIKAGGLLNYTRKGHC